MTQAPGADLFLAGPDTYAPRYDRTSTPSRHRQRILPRHGHIGSDYIPSSPVIRSSPARVTDVEPRGYLRLLVQPGAAQVYVDGLYMGTVDDFSDANPSFEAGPHRVDIRAPGFETVTFDVRILENDTITYRRNLGTIDDTREPAPRLVPAAAPKTFYVIPRCYAGDTPPRSAQLPPGCDAANIRTVPPADASLARGGLKPPRYGVPFILS